jgi:hypothetical protein
MSREEHIDRYPEYYENEMYKVTHPDQFNIIRTKEYLHRLHGSLRERGTMLELEACELCGSWFESDSIIDSGQSQSHSIMCPYINHLLENNPIRISSRCVGNSRNEWWSQWININLFSDSYDFDNITFHRYSVSFKTHNSFEEMHGYTERGETQYVGHDYINNWIANLEKIHGLEKWVDKYNR